MNRINNLSNQASSHSNFTLSFPHMSINVFFSLRKCFYTLDLKEITDNMLCSCQSDLFEDNFLLRSVKDRHSKVSKIVHHIHTLTHCNYLCLDMTGQ